MGTLANFPIKTFAEPKVSLRIPSPAYLLLPKILCCRRKYAQNMPISKLCRISHQIRQISHKSQKNVPLNLSNWDSRSRALLSRHTNIIFSPQQIFLNILNILYIPYWADLFFEYIKYNILINIIYWTGFQRGQLWSSAFRSKIQAS